jgi:hypothetical protein
MKRLFASAVAMLALSASAHAQNVTVGDVKRELMLTAVLTGQIRQGILTHVLDATKANEAFDNCPDLDEMNRVASEIASTHDLNLVGEVFVKARACNMAITMVLGEGK